MTSWVRRMPGTAIAMVVLAAVLLVIGNAVAATGAVSRSQVGGGLTGGLSVTPVARVGGGLTGGPIVTPAARVGGGLTGGPSVTPADRAFVWPLAGAPVVVGAFDPPAEPWLPGHRGVDLAGTLGQRVYAAGAGTVSFAGRIGGTGAVSITHPDGLRTTYEPVAASVHTGDRVAMGTSIGTIDARLAHCPSGPAACLHWGLIRGGVYLDPLILLGLGQVRLYPSP